MKSIISFIGALLFMSIAFAQSARPTPLMAVLVSPDDISGNYISTMGVLSYGQVVQLCIDKDSAKSEAVLNCIVIQNDKSFLRAVGKQGRSLDGRYVQVIGTFDSSSPKPRRYVGVLRDVVIIRRLPL